MSRTLRRTAAKCNPATICAAAAVLASRGRSADAIASYRLALAIAPTFAKAHNDLASLLCEQGRLEEAICHMKRAINCAPERAEPYTNLGNLLQRKGMTADAAQLFAQASALNSPSAEARNDPGKRLVPLDH